MAFRFVLTIALVASVASCQNNGGAGAAGSQTLAKIPGARTAAEALASSANGMSRYLAPDGPIQPGISAIATLPARGAEITNQGITRISSGLHNRAQSLSRQAGQGGNIRMPGLDALESSMPLSLASLGDSMQSMISGKNSFIRNQAESGIKAANRLGDMMRQGLQGAATSVRSSGPAGGAANMLSSAQDFMSKSGAQLQSQMQGHLNGAMNRLDSVRGLGQNVRQQAQGLTRTLSNGAQGALNELQRTGQNVMGQLQNNHAINRQQMTNVLGSLQGSMASMGGNMQKSLEGAIRHARSAGQQLSGSLQKVAQVPMNMLSNIGGNLMKAGGGGQQGGRY